MNDNVRPRETRRRVSEQLRRNSGTFTRMSGPMSSSADAKFLQYMVSMSGVARSEVVLDVACGPGACTLAVRRAMPPRRRPRSLGRANRARARSRGAQRRRQRGVHGGRNRADAVSRRRLRRRRVPLLVPSFHRSRARIRRDGAGGWTAGMDGGGGRDGFGGSGQGRASQRTGAAMRSHARADARGLGVRADLRRRRFHHRDEDRAPAGVSTNEEWTRFGATPPENIPILRAMLEDAIDEDRPGLTLQRDAGTVRLMHTSASFVLDRAV